MSRSNILVVDDSEVSRSVLLSQLAYLGFCAEGADNGFVAVEKVTAHSYDLILMDIFMPGIDGIETASRIRSIQRRLERKSPIVAVSGGADKQTCLQSGLDDFMTKPLLLDDLRNLVERWLPPGDGAVEFERKAPPES
ncbi:MAG TPA: response regulator [Trichormus sp.]|jgi:CheY-like chemotaxis protein